MNKKVFGYVRVSTGEQAKGFSLDGQRDEIRKYCEKNDFVLTHIFEDQTSGTRLIERQGLMAMIDAVDSSIHAVIATESDRLSRDVFQYGWLSTHLTMQRIKVLLINECETKTPSEKAFAKVRAVFAEFETELRQARIIRGTQKAREQQRFMNRPPLGYKMDNKRIIIDPETYKIVQEIYRLALTGLSITSISKQTGIKRSTVGSILCNSFYMDNNLHGKHETFIPANLWHTVRQGLAGRKLIQSHGSGENDHKI